MKRSVYVLWLLAGVALLAGCDQPVKDKKFNVLPSSQTGITFRNTLKETVEFNIFNYMYFYNGGGVAAGDLNGDQLPDLYFTSNQEDNKLYLNLGGLKFKDITEAAGVQGFNGWATGVSMADVNGDGRLDIYVGYIGDYLIYKGRNQLFINEGNDANGIPQFRDRAMEYGLDLVGFATQSTFFDYDRDGDLDLFVLNHSLHQNGTFGPASMRKEDHELAGDKLMRNDNGHFIDVTREAGIYKSVLGYGLGVVVSDVNMDGWPDIYVGNDFHENDYLYINQGNGKFLEQSEQMMLHTSRYTMGVDFADFNNDLLPDLFSADMLPVDPYILKASQAEEPYDIFDFKLNYGYSYQYARNMLQLNQGNGMFSEIGLYSGVSASDWSWSALMADFNLDGNKDIFISNGIMRRSNDMDYINFVSVDSIQMRLKYEMNEKLLEIVKKMPQVKIPNYLFVNNGDSTFTDRSADWGLGIPSYSHGTAYVDLDNDGDLDLVANNVEDEALVAENLARNPAQGPAPHFLRVVLKGDSLNRMGIGAKVMVYAGGISQLQEMEPVRGYQSSVDPRLLFGLGAAEQVDSVRIIWPDDRTQLLTQVKADQQIEPSVKEAKDTYNYKRPATRTLIFKETTAELGIDFKHRENKFVEFTREALLPHMISAEGPAAAVADINGDGREDIFIGGAKWQESALYIQNANGKFSRIRDQVLVADSLYEDVDAAFLDVEKDGDQDLIIVSGGNEFTDSSAAMKPRLLLNNGKGTFTKSTGLPDLYITGSSIASSDINKDGYPDLLITSRCVPNTYGIEPANYILLNDGKGNFADATKNVAPALTEFGFIRQSSFADIDKDGDDDLLLAAEWKPITILTNEGGKLSLLDPANSGLAGTEGIWSSVASLDADGDGDLDLVFGNMGVNSKLHASAKEPLRLYVNDFDANGTTEQVLSYYLQGREYPFYTHDEMVKQMPSLKKRYLSYSKYAEATLHEMFDDKILGESRVYTANMLESVFIENLGGMKFRVRKLPGATQFAPILAIGTDDINGDGHADLTLAGNFYENNIQMGRYDATFGTVLLGNGKGRWTPVPVGDNGVVIKGQVRKLRKVMIGGKANYVAFRNNALAVSFTPLTTKAPL